MIYHTTQAKLILLVILTFGMTVGIYASEGELDPTFGDGGFISTAFGLQSQGISDIEVQPDGKFIAIGTGRVEGALRSIIIRYHPNGDRDTTFGVNGDLILSSGVVRQLALQSDGKIVIAGYTGISTNFDFYVIRLNSNGGLDTSFNGTGVVIVDFRGTTDFARAVAVQTDGKIVVGGSSDKLTTSLEEDFAVARINPDGSLDTTFDGDGKLISSLQERSDFADLKVQTDGKIVAVGESFLFDEPTSNPVGYFTTVRYNTDGSFDTTFNNTGIAFATFDIATAGPGSRVNNRPTSVFLRADGKILVVGTTESCCAPQPLSKIALIQYNPDGSIDTSYGTSGKSQVGVGSIARTSAFETELQSDGKIVFIGSVQSNPKSSGSVVLGRINANGSIDKTFSRDGFNFIQPPANSTIGISTIAIQQSGKTLFGGSITSGSNRNFLLIQFNTTVCRTTSCSGERLKVADFDGDGRTDASVFRGGNWFIQPSSANNPNTFYGVQFGFPSDTLTPADYDGDGETDIAIWRENVSGDLSYFYILESATNSLRVYQLGNTGDDPSIVGDWDGDGKADLAVYREGVNAGQQSLYYYIPSSASVPFQTIIPWGINGDQSLRGDFDGDGKSDAAVFRPSNGVWYVLQSANNQPSYTQWGIATDKRVSGDFDGDGKTDFTVYRDGVWYVLQSSNNQARYVYWGISTDSVVAGDYDGDGLTDFAVWRDGVYYIQNNASSQVTYQQFGSPGDIPVASAYVR